MLFSVVCTWHEAGHSWGKKEVQLPWCLSQVMCVRVGEVRLPPNSLKGSALLIKSPIPSVTLLQPPRPLWFPDDSESTSKET